MISDRTNFACMREYTLSKTLSSFFCALRYISSAWPEASSNFSTNIPRATIAQIDPFFLLFFFLSLFPHSYRRIVLFAARLDRRQLKRSYRPLQRKAALYSRFSVKGSISRLFRNKSRANREIHRGANIKQYYLANVPSARTFLKSITWNFYRRFSMDHGSIIFFLIFSLSWIHSKYFLFNIFLF